LRAAQASESLAPATPLRLVRYGAKREFFSVADGRRTRPESDPRTLTETPSDLALLDLEFGRDTNRMEPIVTFTTVNSNQEFTSAAVPLASARDEVGLVVASLGDPDLTTPGLEACPVTARLKTKKVGQAQQRRREEPTFRARPQ
jgi:hypothetical protein